MNRPTDDPQNPPAIHVRAERPEDGGSGRGGGRSGLLRGDDESRLVTALRAERSVLVALVACDPDGAVLGHILFSRLPIQGTTRMIQGAALAPLAVRPDRQRRGIGGALIRHGLAACSRHGVAAVIVLGDPAYYPRFGFTPAAAHDVIDPFAAGDALMALELIPGSLGEPSAMRYAPAFGEPG